MGAKAPEETIYTQIIVQKLFASVTRIAFAPHHDDITLGPFSPLIGTVLAAGSSFYT